MKWNKEEEQYCVELLLNGKSYIEIAKQINKSDRSVKQKLNSLGYKASDYYDVRYYENYICGNCKKQFKELKSSGRKYCSIEYAYKINFTNLVDKEIIYHECKECKIQIPCYKVFCSSICLQKQKINDRNTKIENGLIHSSTHLKKYLIMKNGYECEICKNNIWNSVKIPLVLDHINGNPYDNFPINLRLICPNCDALTDTYKGKNKGNGRHERRKRYNEGKSY